MPDRVGCHGLANDLLDQLAVLRRRWDGQLDGLVQKLPRLIHVAQRTRVAGEVVPYPVLIPEPVQAGVERVVGFLRAAKLVQGMGTRLTQPESRSGVNLASALPISRQYSHLPAMA